MYAATDGLAPQCRTEIAGIGRTGQPAIAVTLTAGQSLHSLCASFLSGVNRGLCPLPMMPPLVVRIVLADRPPLLASRWRNSPFFRAEIIFRVITRDLRRDMIVIQCIFSL